MAFNTETLLNAGKTFLMLFGELFGLFIGISFVVALLQVYISQEHIFFFFFIYAGKGGELDA